MSPNAGQVRLRAKPTGSEGIPPRREEREEDTRLPRPPRPGVAGNDRHIQAAAISSCLYVVRRPQTGSGVDPTQCSRKGAKHAKKTARGRARAGVAGKGPQLQAAPDLELLVVADPYLHDAGRRPAPRAGVTESA